MEGWERYLERGPLERLLVAKADSSGFPLGVTESGIVQQQEETFHRALGEPAESSGQQGPGPIPDLLC